MGGVWDRGRARRGEGLHGSNKCNGKFAFAGHGAARNESRGGEKGAKGELAFFLYPHGYFSSFLDEINLSRDTTLLSSPLPKRYNFPFSSKSSPANRNGYATLHAQYENFNQVLKTREKVVVSLKFARNLSNAAIKAKGVKKIRCVYKYSRRRRRTTINLGKKRRRE